MDKYNRLLSRIAERYGIKKGNRESPESWKCRIIYSVAGQMGLVSLWDSPEDGTVSVVHMKRRMTGILESYRDLYPELCLLLPQDMAELSEEMYSVFLHAGAIYHRAERVTLSMPSSAAMGDLHLCRGASPEARGKISGLGMYSKASAGKSEKTVFEMFNLGNDTLQDRWNETVSQAHWIRFEEGAKTEYLRMQEPYTRGYWLDQPVRDGRVSMLRSVQTGVKLYYLYRFTEGQVEVSPLPVWRTQNYGYRSLSNACLAAYGVLPAMTIQTDGDIVHISMRYLLPPAELNFLKLYSWPESMRSQPCDFKRVCSRQAFKGIQTSLSQQGYMIREG